MDFFWEHPFSEHTYYGKSEIHFIHEEQGGLFVTIDTDRLHLRSVEATEAEYDRYATLFGSEEVMCKYATGEIKTREEIKARIKDVWAERWHDNDPYSGFAVFKKETGDFIGHVALGHGATAGESELAYLFLSAEWGKGYGSEAVTALVKEYAPATVQEGYRLEGRRLEKIVATVRSDHPASNRILQKVGMHFVGQAQRHGFLRYHYSIDLKELQAETGKKVANCCEHVFLKSF